MRFDEIYARVPAEQVERLKGFRFTHKYKHLHVDGVEWEYILPRSLFAPLFKLRLNKILHSTLSAAKHPEFEFWRAYLNEAVASNRLNEVAVHQNKCLLDLARQPQFTPEDLKEWRGGILIIDSDNDPAISAKDRELLRNTYPQAQTHTFHGAGHASSILKREEFVSITRSFLDEPADRRQPAAGNANVEGQ